MASRSETPTTRKSLLVAELEKVYPDVAKKMHTLDQLHAKVAKADGGTHRPLTKDERKTQEDNTLSAEEYRLAQQIEYGTFVAEGSVQVGNTLGYTDGHPVPVSVVERLDLEKGGYVRRVAKDEEGAK